MSSNEIQTNDVNGSRLAEQGPSSGRCSRQGNIGRHHANPVISKRRKWSSQENKIVMECYLLSKPKVRGYRKHMLSLWLNKGMFWVSEKRLVDLGNTIRRNSWMTELEIEELEKSNLGEEVRDIVKALEPDEKIGNLEEEEVTIIEEIAEVLERR